MIKDIVHPKTGQLGYLVKVSLGRIDGRVRYKTRSFYGISAFEAQKQESLMAEASRRCQMADGIADIYREFIRRERKKGILVKNGFDKFLEKPNAPASPEKIRQKRSYWKDFYLWLKKNAPLVKYMGDITPAMAEKYVAYIKKNGRFRAIRGEKLSVYTLNQILITCRSVCKALRHDVVGINPFDEIPLIKEKGQSSCGRMAYSEDQLKTIFEKADSFMRPLFFIGLFTGLSEGDVCTLRKDEINFAHRHIYHCRIKTGVESSIPMLPVLHSYLEVLCGDPENSSDYVLPEHHALYTTKSYEMSRKVKSFLEDVCGFETKKKSPDRSKAQSVLDFHSLRHTFCTMAGVVGIPLTVVQSIVGHMTPAMTKLYSRHVDEKARLHWIDLFGEKIASAGLSLPDGDN